MKPWELLKKYLTRSASSAEVEKLLEYIKNHPDEKFSEINEELWDNINTNEFDEAKLEGVFDKVKNQLNARTGRSSIQNQKISFFPNILKIAAAIVIITVSALVVYYFSGKWTTSQGNIRPEITEVIKSNPSGLKSKIYLPDGSLVWLNSESNIKFPEKFSPHKREIFLDGEAYFEVVKKDNCPFTVISGSVRTTALGTSFNIKAFEEENVVTVALQTGKVLVEDRSPSSKNRFTLDPGFGIKFDKEEKVFEKFNFDARRALSWKDGVLVFNEAQQREIFEVLRRWYGANFTFTNKSEDTHWNYSAEFENESLENVLKSIGYSKGFQFTIDNKDVKITFH